MLDLVHCKAIRGLGSRLLAVESAVRMGRAWQCSARIYWEPDRDCEIGFLDLFHKPDGISGISNNYAEVVASRPRYSMNIEWMPGVLIDPHLVPYGGRNFYCQAYGRFVNVWSQEPFCFELEPTPAVAQAFTRRLQELKISRHELRNMLGVHIRRTDNAVAIDQSPDEAIIHGIRDFLQGPRNMCPIRHRNHSDRHQFDRDLDREIHRAERLLIVTDSAATAEQFRSVFPGEVLAMAGDGARDRSAMVQAAADLLVLGGCGEVWGCVGSNYGRAAALAAARSFEEVTRP
jgi:hypothetical protein